VDGGNTLNMTGDDVSQNKAKDVAGVGGNGGAIENDGTLTVSNSWIGGNTADPSSGHGGAIESTGAGQLTVKNISTLSGNSAVYGGAVAVHGLRADRASRS
jgi:hypothetical protein